MLSLFLSYYMQIGSFLTACMVCTGGWLVVMVVRCLDDGWRQSRWRGYFLLWWLVLLMVHDSIAFKCTYGLN